MTNSGERPATAVTTAASGTSSGNLRPMCDWADNRAQHFTTIRYRINQKTWLRTAANTGVFSASHDWKSEGANVPLASEHSGGVNVAGRGRVGPVPQRLDRPLMLARYATRDDGRVMTSIDDPFDVERFRIDGRAPRPDRFPLYTPSVNHHVPA